MPMQCIVEIATIATIPSDSGHILHLESISNPFSMHLASYCEILHHFGRLKHVETFNP